jgi:hypothetical protein
VFLHVLGQKTTCLEAYRARNRLLKTVAQEIFFGNFDEILKEKIKTAE